MTLDEAPAGVVALVVLMAACGTTAAQLVVTAGETCHYQGPARIEAGEHEILVIGDGSADLYLLSPDVGYEEVAAHFDASEPAHHPPGATRIVGLTGVVGLNEDRSLRDGTSRRHEFTAGDYAVVCEWPGGRAAVAPLTVTD